MAKQSTDYAAMTDRQLLTEFKRTTLRFFSEKERSPHRAERLARRLEHLNKLLTARNLTDTLLVNLEQDTVYRRKLNRQVKMCGRQDL